MMEVILGAAHGILCKALRSDGIHLSVTGLGTFSLGGGRMWRVVLKTMYTLAVLSLSPTLKGQLRGAV